MGSALSQTTEARVVRGVRVSGRYYKCFWYAPEVKRWVKSTEENYSSNGSLSLTIKAAGEGGLLIWNVRAAQAAAVLRALR